MAVQINIVDIFTQVLTGLLISAGPALIKVGGFLIAINLLKDWVLAPILISVATEYKIDSAKRLYYDIYIEPYAEEEEKRKKRRIKEDANYNKWLDGTDIFEDDEKGYKLAEEDGNLPENNTTYYEEDKDWAEDFDFFEEYADSLDRKEENKW